MACVYWFDLSGREIEIESGDKYDLDDFLSTYSETMCYHALGQILLF
jgi:hypothetical protein